MTTPEEAKMDAERWAEETFAKVAAERRRKQALERYFATMRDRMERPGSFDQGGEFRRVGSGADVEGIKARNMALWQSEHDRLVKIGVHGCDGCGLPVHEHDGLCDLCRTAVFVIVRSSYLSGLAMIEKQLYRRIVYGYDEDDPTWANGGR